MARFVQGDDRRQDYLLPASLDDYVSEDNPVRAIEAFIDSLDLKALEFAGMTPAVSRWVLVIKGDDPENSDLSLEYLGDIELTFHYRWGQPDPVFN
jgi:hypothetical protein